MSAAFHLAGFLDGGGHLPRCGSLTDAGVLLVGNQDGSITQFSYDPTATPALTHISTAPSVHEGIVFAVAPVPRAHPVFPEGSVVSGGGDCLISVSLADGTVLTQLRGHTGAVGALVFLPDGTLVTGGWDGAIRAWRGEESVFEEVGAGHKYATSLCVLAPTASPAATAATAAAAAAATATAADSEAESSSTSTPLVLASGSGSMELHLDTINSLTSTFSLTRVATVPAAHSHLIRCLRPHPLGFYTCGNDGWVRLWSPTASLLASFQAYTPTEEQSEFIYDCVMLPNGSFCAAGDDKTLCFFTLTPSPESGGAGGGRRTGSFTLPQAARALVPLPNGDVIAIGGGGIVTVSADPAHAAAAPVAEAFRALFTPPGGVGSGGSSGIDVGALPGTALLLQPPKAGAARTVMVNQEGKPMVYVWSDDAYEWQLQGEALGTKPAGSGGAGAAPKKMYQGVEYDHVVPVDVDPSLPPLQLPFNRTDDPSQIAAAFIALHGLPPDYRQQVEDFITPLIDMDAVRARREAAAAAEAGARLLQTPVWTSTGFMSVSACKAQVISDAITRRNATLAASHSALALSAEELTVLSQVVLPCAEHATLVEPPTFTPAAAAVVVKLLQWPVDQLPPCLDLLRVVLAHPGACAMLLNPSAGDATFAAVSQTLFNAISGPGATMATTALALQALTNWTVHRTPAPCESPGLPTAAAPAPVAIFLAFAGELAGAGLRSPHPRCRAEGARLWYNIIVYLGRTRGMRASPLWEAGFKDLSEALPSAADAAGTTATGVGAGAGAGVSSPNNNNNASAASQGFMNGNTEAQYFVLSGLTSIAATAPALSALKTALALAVESRGGGSGAVAAAWEAARALLPRLKEGAKIARESGSRALGNVARDMTIVFHKSI